jgi:hypothetical protein
MPVHTAHPARFHYASMPLRPACPHSRRAVLGFKNMAEFLSTRPPQLLPTQRPVSAHTRLLALGIVLDIAGSAILLLSEDVTTSIEEFSHLLEA